jgi:GntR family transcriptional regulator
MNLGMAHHRRVSLVLSDGIATGRYPVGEALPGEEALARMFQVSRVTVRRALADLHLAGLVDRRHGLGTFVRKQPGLDEAGPMNRLVSQIEEAGKLDVAVIEFEYIAPVAEFRTLLKLEAKEEVQRVVRVRSDKRRPIMHLTTYVPESIGRSYTRKDLARTPLFELLAKAGKSYRKAREAIGACLADPMVAPLLRVPIGAPLLLVQRLMSTAADEPVEYLEVRASPDAYALTRSWDADSNDQRGRTAPY